jgi:hypothetical protein
MHTIAHPRSGDAAQPSRAKPAAHAANTPSPLADQFLSVFDHRLRRSIVVRAPRADVVRAFEGSTMADGPLFKALLWIRSLGRATFDDPPILDGMRKAEFVAFEEIPGHEIVCGMAGHFWSMRNPFVDLRDRQEFLAADSRRYAKTIAAFHFDDVPAGTRFTVETRVADPLDPRLAARFRWYWRLVGIVGAWIWMGSALAATRRLSERLDRGVRDPR